MYKGKIDVKLLRYGSIYDVIDAIRICKASREKSDTEFFEYLDCVECNSGINTGKIIIGPNDLKLIKNILKNKHESVLEHCCFVFEMKNIPRFILQEIARHRIGVSFSVQSSRYTLNKTEPIFNLDYDMCYEKNPELHYKLKEMETLLFKYMEKILSYDVANDYKKFFIVESLCCDFLMTVNIRSLRHFIEVRKKGTHFLFQNIIEKIYNEIHNNCDEFDIFFEDLKEINKE